MSIDLRKIRSVLGGRVARNVYFWGILAYTRTEFNYTTTQALFTTALFGLLMVLFYTNNLLLIPAYLSKKKYTQYLLRYIPLCIVVSAGYLAVIKMAFICNPGYHVGMISPIVFGGETAAFTVTAFLAEGWPYTVCLFAVGCMFAMSWYVMDYQRQQKLVEQARQKQVEMELTFLKNQINPHFLFNSLNNLYALTVKKSDLAPEVVSKISAILRYLLYESDRKTVSFEKEKEIMRAYIDLELLRIPDTQNMQFTITADKEYAIPPLLWLPVLENAFKHGTGFISDSYFINYEFRIADNVLHIHSCNTFKAQTGGQTTGIGLTNLAQRLKLLFGKDHTINLTKENDRYNADIEINLENV